ncbi:hypothetical protein H8R18_01810 [Nanchangia anserum]|uniref:Uncharacterized protein n=1 Tax=Nanchangia anserum TaxID=2692125 RepID=A0A8I0KWK3_9ACTO|nr:DUF6541 family protein [Nanchangia anserum]MBD3690084.1 hypothetical protein [Nanchangia anserum]QOX82123.1 hypothetical protein H8R18_01810 [Nanchangia anserum]
MLAAASCGVLVGLLAVYMPGYLLARAGGYGRMVSLGAAPALSVALIATIAIVYGAAGLRWSLLSVGGALAVLACVCAVIIAWRRRGAEARPFGWWMACEVFAGAAGGSAIAISAYHAGTTGFDTVAQTFDAPFHLNAVEWIVRGGDASTMHLGRLVNGGFYPAAWHDVVSLIALCGIDVVTATHLAVCVSLVALAASQAVLAAAVTSRLPGAACAVGIMAALYVAFPYRLAAYGTVWPNFFAYVLIPPTMCLLVDAVARARAGRAVGLWRWLVAACAVAGVGLAQPNGAFALIIVGVIALVAFTWQRLRAEQRPSRVDGIIAWGWPVAVAAVLYGLSRTSIMRNVLEWDSRHSDPTSSIRSYVIDLMVDTQFGESPGLGNPHPAVWLAVLTCIGAVYVVYRRRHWWFLAAGLAFGILYVGSMKEWAVTATLARVWYYDQVRIGALAPLILAPLAGIGLAALVSLVMGALARVPHVPAWVRHRGIATALVLAVIGCAAPATHTWRFDSARAEVFRVYQIDPGLESEYNNLVSRPELDFQRDFDHLLPRGATVIGSPYTGAVTIYSVSDVNVVYPHFGGSWDDDQTLLAYHFNELGHDPAVCRALERRHVGYYYWDSRVFWKPSELYTLFPGLTYTHRLDPYLTLVAQRDGVKLFKITGCSVAQRGGRHG